MMPSFSGEIVCFLVPVYLLFDRSNNHEVHVGTGHFEVDFNLGQITGGKEKLFTFGYSIVCSLINYLLWYMLTPIFQCHSIN